MNKKVETHINEIAKMLPDMLYSYRQTFHVKEADIRKYGLNICKHEYYLTTNIFPNFNHKRRLVRAFNRNGMDGINNYVKRLLK